MIFIDPVVQNYPRNAEGYLAYIDDLARLNRLSILPIGVRKRWWHLFKIEHPLTTKEQK